MKKNLFLTLVFIFLISCVNEEKQVNQGKKPCKKATSIKKTVIKRKYKEVPKFNITDNSVVSVLSTFGNFNKEDIIIMQTSKGDMKIKLYNNTPLHKANFLLLSKNKFYENTEFYRVIKDFMIQGGDSDDENRPEMKSKFGRYTIPNEINKNNIHKKGAIAMAREYKKNPKKRSSSFDFFIVQGKIYTPGELKAVEIEKNITYTEAQKQIYYTIGGAPHLDGDHSVFGEVISGLEVIDSIANTRIDKSNWPYSDVKINIEILNQKTNIAK